MDRDGTLIVPPEDRRVDSPEKVKLFPDTLEAMKLLANNGYKVIIVTNQSGISEGRFTSEEYSKINQHFVDLLAPSGIEILKVCTCPHRRADNCECRKPKPTMILEAAKEFGFDPKDCFMVGDRQDDIDIAKNSGAKAVLVKTGDFPVDGADATFVAENLLEATEFIISN
ncbi:MAG TPA: HAD family hydrolase [Candidatus Saccharimonadales bacterium]|nr:HAD family hydrolase [Candidatus Saccharimonadales bacterium]